jgi:hypothetical protein
MVSYFITDNVNIDDVLSSWVMTDNEKESYINYFRSSPHKFMPTMEFLYEIEKNDYDNLQELLRLNNIFYVIKNDKRIISIATIINYYGENILVYQVPFRYQNNRSIYDVIKKIKKENGINNDKRFNELNSSFERSDISSLDRHELSSHEVALNSIKYNIDLMINEGIDKETIITEIMDYLNQKTYHK